MDVVISKYTRGAYHETWCPYARKIQRTHRAYLSEEKAIRRGYTECKYCHSPRGFVTKYQKDPSIKSDISYDPVDDAFCVRTNVGFWKLIWRNNVQNWQLFHMNHTGWDCFNPELPNKKLMRGSFHRQIDFSSTTSLRKAISYIEEHDKVYALAKNGIKNLPENNSKNRYNKKRVKNAQKRKSVRNVYKIFEELERSAR
jgi:hypothetical protein